MPIDKKAQSRGGARPGAGRKATDTKEVKIRLTPGEHEALKKLGGSRWVKEQIAKVRM